MSLAIDEHAQQLRMLLYIRHAWGLADDLPLPALHPVPEAGSSAMPDEVERIVWERRWLRTWAQAWGGQTHGPYRPPGTGKILPDSGLRSDTVFWTAQYGSAGLDLLAFDRWEQMFEPSLGPSLDPVLRSPQAAPVLVAAWERGLESFTVVPWAGYCTYRLSASHLATSFDTAASWSLLNRALAEWIRTPLASCGGRSIPGS